jgi:hypothetical protein
MFVRCSSLAGDVQIGGWSRPWKLKGDRSVGGAPAAAMWATDPAGFGQVVCEYTAQGFEYDYAGVIIGPDLVWRETGREMVRAANKDPDLRNRTKVAAQADWLIRNAYKVLRTRDIRVSRPVQSRSGGQSGFRESRSSGAACSSQPAGRTGPVPARPVAAEVLDDLTTLNP